MKKTLVAALLMACGMASAQKLTYIPYEENGYLTGSAVSSNGRYIAGGDRGGQAFIFDVETGQLKYFASTNLFDENAGDVAATVSHVTDEGVGVGYLEGCATRFSFATGEWTRLHDGFSTATYSNADGSFMCGYTFDEGYITSPCWWRNGVLTPLPQPAARLLDFNSNGASVVTASGNGETIIGYAVDDFASMPLLVWQRDLGDSTYSVQPMCRNWFDGSFDLDGRQPYDWFEGAAISDNGQWVAINLHVKDPDFSLNTGMVMARYNVETDSLQILDCPDADASTFYYATGITNDGMVVGYIENGMASARTAIVCPAGETRVEAMASVYEGATEIAAMDGYGLNTPCAVTPDGRYIVGFGYVSLSESDLCFGTWILDTQAEATAVDGTQAGPAAQAKATAAYTIDGKALGRTGGRGLTIERMAKGPARKVVR